MSAAPAPTAGRFTRPLRHALITAGPFVAAAVVHAAVFLSVHARLPDTVATRVGGEGSAFTTPLGALVLTQSLFAVEAAVFAYPAWRAAGTLRGQRFNVVAAWALAGFTGYLCTALLLANAGAASGFLVRFPLMTHLPAAAMAGALASAIGVVLTGRINE